MIDENMLVRVRGFWARRAGVPVDQWADGRALVVATHHPSVSVVGIGSAALVWCPPHLQPRICGMAPEALVELSTLEETFADQLDRPLGSAVLPYLSASNFRRPAENLDVAVERSPAGYASFVAASTPAERDESGMPTEPERRCWVSRVNGDIAALVTYEVWDDTVAHLLALTAPHRGAGHGVRAAAAACADLLSEGELLPQWRVSQTNHASAAVARKLGFVTVGRQSTILLRRPMTEGSAAGP